MLGAPPPPPPRARARPPARALAPRPRPPRPAQDGTITYKLGDTGITLRYAYLSQRGYYPEDLYKANQDSFKVVEKFNGAQSNLLFGVFDGHGSDGDSCSYFVRDSIEKTLKKTMAAHPDDFERAYKECFVTINKAMHKMDFDDTMSGTTAITAFFNDSEARPGSNNPP